MRDTVLEQYLAKMGFLRDDYIGIENLSMKSSELLSNSRFALIFEAFLGLDEGV